MKKAAHEYARDNKPNRKFKAGTVVVDIYDVADRKLIYRDFATKEILSGQTMVQRQQEVRNATDEAIAKFVD